MRHSYKDSEQPKNSPEPRKNAAPKRKNARKPNATALMIIPKPPPGKRNQSETRVRFIKAFEAFCGNVAASCEFAGIHRATYYRWMQSKSKINRRFQLLVTSTRPIEKTVDLLNEQFLKRVEEGSDTLIKFGLERLDPRFKVPEAPAKQIDEEQDRLAKVALAYKSFLAELPQREVGQAFVYLGLDQSEWIRIFAQNGNVETKQLEAQIQKQVTKK